MVDEHIWVESYEEWGTCICVKCGMKYKSIDWDNYLPIGPCIISEAKNS